MASHQEGVNPLRPYYIPPSIGEPSGPPAGPSPSTFSRSAAANAKYASKARDIFNDIDYKDYLGEPSSSVVQTVKDLIDELLWKYTVVLIAQPFGVAKTVLQVRNQDDPAAEEAVALEPQTPQRQVHGYDERYGGGMYDYADEDSDPDETAYFTTNFPVTPTPSYGKNRHHRRISSPLQSPRLQREPVRAPHQLDLRRPDSTRAVIRQLWQKEGAWGVWKGANATFIYTVLQSLLENWSRSCLSALFNVPDLGVKDNIDRLVDIASPYPWASLFVAATAAVATGLILAPLDIVRTRLLLTSTSRPPRRTLETLRSLPSYLCPSMLVIPTVLHSLVHPLLTLSTPLVLRSRFMIDNNASPTTFSVAKFCSSFAALFVRLPLETVLRRGQMAVLSSQPYIRGVKDQKLETIVSAGQYRGVLGTMYYIVKEEGSHAVKKSGQKRGKSKGKAKITETVYRKGQGLEGLWRGFGVSWWGLVGLWTVGILGNAGDGEF